MSTTCVSAFVLLKYAFAPLITMFMLSKLILTFLLGVELEDSVYREDVQNLGIARYYSPPKTEVNDLRSAIDSKGVYGFIFNTSQTPPDMPYATYNWCNMPHVRAEEYVVLPPEYQIKYVEVLHRHHKRTPYASNVFPIETQQWDCSDTALYYHGQPNTPDGNTSATTYWRFFKSDINPFEPAGFSPHSCAFPQITKQGLDDSFQHGRDLYGVYHGIHSLMPESYDDSKVSFRVTNNVITSQVAGMVINGMFATTEAVALNVQAQDVDSLEPTYSCPSSSALYARHGPGSNNPSWRAHLDGAADLFTCLDSMSGISRNDLSWHMSLDHYFDNLSARLCHQHLLPCNQTFDPPKCVDQADANEVFRLGEYEYAFQYRSAGAWTLDAAKSSFGVWIGELSQHLLDVSEGRTGMVYRHNVAHDGSVSRLLSILQLEDMVWPGMGSEVVFELYQKENDHFVRILWSGDVLKSSSPALKGDVHGLVPLPTLLKYFEALVGARADRVRSLCNV